MNDSALPLSDETTVVVAEKLKEDEVLSDIKDTEA